MFKLQWVDQISWSGHRSGWKYIVKLLQPYTSGDGVLLDGFIDASFGFQAEQARAAGRVPYRQDWVGFWHHPVQIPPWLTASRLAPGSVLQGEAFRESLPFCQGVFTFSEYLAAFLRERLPVPVETLYHPTEFPAVTFDPDRFAQTRQIVQVGSWLRRLTSFYRFRTPGYTKLHLLGKSALHYLKLEMAYYAAEDFHLKDVGFIPYVDDDAYDDLLAESIVFVDLYDSSVNNTVIECIARNTPLLVNKLPSVVEYLGEEYPLYYASLDEVPGKVGDPGRLRAAHQYLVQLPLKRKLTGEYFLQSLAGSAMMSVLPASAHP